MSRRRALLALVACLLLAILVSAPSASAARKFHPRVRGALGLIPPVNKKGLAFAPDIASGSPTAVTYHGGTIMAGGVTVHTIFWTGGTNPFPGSPQAGAPTYQGMIQQFFTDLAADSSGTSGRNCTSADCNTFTTLPQFAEGTTPGGVTSGDYTVNYNTATDSIVDTNPYPDTSVQCSSPNNAGTCITDGQIQQEIDNIAPANERGLHNLWYVFLPPDVDECILPGICGSDAFEAYHSDFDISSNGLTIYALGIDPVIEVGPIAPGADPNGNPDAESTSDAAGHETEEAMTDPQGVGWMDPNGFEVADKCEFGPQIGQVLGNAGPDHAEYNQVINSHKYIEQMMWSNDDMKCVQATTQTSNPLPLPEVTMTQFSSTVSGNTENATPGTGVQVSLIRNEGPSADPSTGNLGNPVTVAQASTTTAADGSWSVSLAPHAVGDDRDEIDVDYSGPGAPNPNHQVILTGNGDNPFGEAGWTGWTDLDNGAFLTNDPSVGPSLSLGPCFQTGVLHATRNGSSLGSPTDFCGTATDVATVSTGGPVSPGDVITQGSNDNRAFQGPDLEFAPGGQVNQNGGLVDMTVPVGEPDAINTFPEPLPPVFPFGGPSGFPTCGADLEAQTVSCSGLVSGENYTVTDNRTGESHSGSADDHGNVSVPFATGGIHGGDAMALSNGARTLTTLHVAHLRVDLTGENSKVTGGSCEAGQYYAPPLSQPPLSGSAGDPTGFTGGAALTDQICPTNGNAAGLPADNIAQTDELSGGQTTTQVPHLEDTSPMEGENVYGNFTALAESGLPGKDNTIQFNPAGTRISLSISHAGGGAPVFTSSNVETSNGVPVNGLTPGTYSATWTIIDANGDTRAVTTRFVVESSPSSGHKKSKPKVSCKRAKHSKVRCTVTYKDKSTKGTLRMRIAKSGHVYALGHGRVKHGKAKLTLHDLRQVKAGRYNVTLVLSGKTTRMKVRVR